MAQSLFMAMVEEYNLEPADIVSRYKIPQRTVYSWFQGNRQPPDYVITMISRLEAQRHGKLGKGTGKSQQGSKETGEKG